MLGKEILSRGCGPKNIKSPLVMSDEPLLREDDKRYVMFPIRDQAIWAMYKKQVDCFWRAEEVDLSRDMQSWATLTSEEKHFIKMVLAFFAASDGIVLENLGVRFMADVQLAEARAFYGFQIAMENIHSEVYSLLIDTYVTDRAERGRLFNALNEFPCIRRKADWAMKWIQDENASFATRLLAFACVEGIFFSGSFCAVFWLKKRGKMPGLTFSNELIARDEALHTEFAVLLYGKLQARLSTSEATALIKGAVDIEREFICEALPCRLLGMNSRHMSQYIQFCADRLLVQLGYPKAYHSSCPFDFMEHISVEGKTNFFEKRVGEYALANKTQTKATFAMDSQF